jgi:hypothetical protein
VNGRDLLERKTNMALPQISAKRAILSEE